MGLASSGAAPLVIVWIVIVVFEIAAFWRVFSKAGHHGWAAIIPIYNAYVLCKIARRPGWWLILFLVPFVNIVISLVVAIDVAKWFGKGTGFGLGLWILAPIFYPVLGFGSARYQG